MDRSARRSIGASCEVFAAGLILVVSFAATIVMFFRLYGGVGVLAWLIAFSAWAIAAASGRLAAWNPAEALTTIVLGGSFTAQLLINVRVPHAGDAVFVASHFALVTSALRASPFPCARLVRRRPDGVATR